MGLALHSYHDEYEKFPCGYSPNGIFTYTGWQLQLLPYLEQESLWNASVTYLTANQGGTDTNSFPACGYVLKTFVCPSNQRPVTMVYGGSYTVELTSYLGNAGTTSNPVSADGVLYSGSQVRLTDITDGTSNTYSIGERPCTGDLIYGWGFSPYGGNTGQGDTVLGSLETGFAGAIGDLATNIGLQPPRQPANTAEIDGAHFWSFHPGGANFLFCDGSVHFLAYSTNSVLPR
jgi:prepilin-type processing-associated H-X9-DG protein